MADIVSIADHIVKYMENIYGEKVNLLKKDLDDYEFNTEDLNRIKYYVGDRHDKKILLYKSNLTNLKELGTGRLQLLNYEYLLNANISNKIKNRFAWPLLNIFSVLPEIYKSKRFLYRIGDHHKKATTKGIIAKTRIVSDSSVTLLKITPARHWGKIKEVKDSDIPYKQKKDMIVWRGATTGRKKITATRYDFVSKYFDESQIMNVGFSKITHNIESYSDLVKGRMTLEEQLQYKFLVSLQGNDVASGLKWMLYSNSVVMMAKPTICSWAMEDQLEPFVHYLPLEDDFSNLEEIYQWAISNEDACIAIANNATKFIEKFLDLRRELLLECEVMRRYLDNIEILD